MWLSELIKKWESGWRGKAKDGDGIVWRFGKDITRPDMGQTTTLWRVDEEWTIITEPFTFIEAANSGKKIKHIEWLNYLPLDRAIYVLGQHTAGQITDRINEKAWLIEEWEGRKNNENLAND